MKYFAPETDYAALERELTGAGSTPRYDSHEDYQSDEEDYADYVDKYAADFDDEDERR